MSLDTGIAYLHDTWNFIRGGCTCEIRSLKMADGEKRDGCWSSVSSRQQGWNFNEAHPLWGDNVWKLPYERDRELQRNGKTKIVFAGDLTDFFADTTVHKRLRPRAWDLIKDTPNTTYYVSTKVPRNLLKPGFLPGDWNTGYPNVMLVVSVTASNTSWRMDVLRDVPARMRVVSFEPLWGPIGKVNPTGFDWFIVGGHSGPGYYGYPMKLEWAKELWDVAQDSKLAYFFKQVSAHSDEQGIDALDRLVFGKTFKTIRTRQWPPLPYPMIPKAEKGNRFTDAEWDSFLGGTSPKPKLVQIIS